MDTRSAFHHTPIMVDEVMGLLLPQRGGVFVDGTLGGGGHSEAILRLLPASGRLIGVDRDEEALAAAGARLAPFSSRFTAIKGNFFSLRSLLLSQGVETVDGILLDLGVSSYQLDEPERGFSYKHDAPLDMRMDRSEPLSAYKVVNEYAPEELARIFREYGEERFAGLIARHLAEQREKAPIKTTGELSRLIGEAIPARFRFKEQQHPARRCFQAIRIEVNGELAGLEKALEGCLDLLSEGGRLVVLTFHSLEDRIVKTVFKTAENPCVCSPKSPQCICGREPYGRVLTRHPLVASQEEQRDNPRSCCCKLRALEKTKTGIVSRPTAYREGRK